MKETSAGSILQNIVGKEKMQEICELLGGLKIYIPDKPLPLQRDSIIKNEYEQLVASGKNKMDVYRHLAKNYALSERRIMQIVNSC